MATSAAAVKLVSILLVVSAASFAVGVAIERSQHRETTTETAAAHSAESTTGEAATATEQPAAVAGVVAPAESAETLLGVSTESTGLVALAVIVSLLLAALLWLRGALPALVAAAGLVGLAFAAFDVREAIHQSDLSNRGLLAIALVVLALHGSVVLAAGRVLLPRRESSGLAG